MHTLTSSVPLLVCVCVINATIMLPLHKLLLWWRWLFQCKCDGYPDLTFQCVASGWTVFSPPSAWLMVVWRVLNVNAMGHKPITSIRTCVPCVLPIDVDVDRTVQIPTHTENYVCVIRFSIWTEIWKMLSASEWALSSSPGGYDWFSGLGLKWIRVYVEYSHTCQPLNGLVITHRCLFTILFLSKYALGMKNKFYVVFSV